MAFESKDYFYHVKELENISRMLDVSKFGVKDSLNKFYAELKELEKDYYQDLLFEIRDLYIKFIEVLSDKDVLKSFDYIYRNYNSIIDPSVIDIIFKKHPSIIDSCLEKIFKKIQKEFKRGNTKFIDMNFGLITICLSYFDSKKRQDLIDRILNFTDENLKIINKKFIPQIYGRFPDLRKKLFNFIISYPDTDSNEGLEDLYKNLTDIISIDNSITKKCLSLINKHLRNENLDKNIVGYMIKILSVGYNIPEYKESAEKIIGKIKSKQKNFGLENQRAIARIIGDTDRLRSTMLIGQRVEKTEENPHGFQIVNGIPIDETCVLFLGGNGTTDGQKLNGYLGDVKTVLEKSGLDGKVGIYGVIYNFGDVDKDEKYAFRDERARKFFMFKHGRRKIRAKFDAITEDDINPRYVKILFETVFLPRISKNGQKIDAESAKRNIRKINVVAHCHGSYTFLKVEELMWQKMSELGYTKQEMTEIQKQLLCVCYAPYCPLGISKSEFISFATANDANSKYGNLFGNVGRKIIKDEG
ncbi:MAG: hypothetical protein IKZ49_04725, partial [Alphaproteobacteria bacterium]|nr:hypothetical protein [Alphaproteobacteria bacterium]